MKKILYIVIDKVPEVDAFVDEIRQLSVWEQVARVSNFIKSKFKNAMSPATKDLSPGERIKLEKALQQENGRKLSECLELEYAVCVEYHALGKTIFDDLGILCEFKTGSIGRGPDHTYLDIEVDGEWEIFDPFAEVYLEDVGQPGAKLFHEAYYSSSNSRR